MSCLKVGPGKPENRHVLERCIGILFQQRRHGGYCSSKILPLVGIETRNENLRVFRIEGEGRRWEENRNEEEYSQNSQD